MIQSRETLAWLAAVKEETHRKTRGSSLTQGCAQGRIESIYALLIGFWPFVHTFPEMIKAKYDDSGDRKARILAEMEQDERGHNALWFQACKTVGISDKQLAQEPLPLIRHLNDVIGEDTDLYKTFLRFLAVEIIAEALSEALLPHAAFCEQVGKRGQAWFKVHLTAENEALETSHEIIATRLAKLYAPRTVTDEEFAAEVSHAIDCFIEAGEECQTELALVAI
jgi:hypothetical protein